MSTATLEAPVKTSSKPKTDNKVGVFKLLTSVHITIQEGWQRPVHPETGKPLFNDPETGQVIVPPKHTYRANEPGNNIVRSEKDLVKIFGPDKFQRISGDPGIEDVVSAANDELVRDNQYLKSQNETHAARIAELEALLGMENRPSTQAGLAGMTKDALVQFCEENEIDIGEARTKAEILAVAQEWQTNQNK